MKLQKTKLPSEDLARIARLYEEAMSRLHEIALITERVTKKPIGRQYVIRLDSSGSTQGSRAQIEFKGVEYIYQNGKCVGTYDHDAGTCSAGCD
jgi:hypothetical protein